MPRLPGRESTRPTVDDPDELEVASFIMSHEEWLWRQPCTITGCDHRMGPKTDEPGWVERWKSCDESQLPAYVVFEQNIEQSAGIACPCHVAQILDRDRG